MCTLKGAVRVCVCVCVIRELKKKTSQELTFHFRSQCRSFPWFPR